MGYGLWVIGMMLGIGMVMQAEEFLPVVVHEDGSVTFRYCGEAKHVKLQSDFQYVGEDSTDYTDHPKNIKMLKDSTGCFSVTTRPIQPETYTYCYRVDGKRVPDPMNNDTAWQKMHKWSVFTVGGTPYTNLYLPPERQGELIQTHWYCHEEGFARRVNIYLPADYDPDEEPLDVLYLMHGINGYEGAWTERGRVIQIMENMVAQGRIKPMIVVMPDVNFAATEELPSLHTMWNSLMTYSRQKRARIVERSLLDLRVHIDSTYHVTGRNAIAGLSDGARVAANTAKLDPKHFYAVGMFSPVVPRKQRKTDPEIFIDPETALTIYMVFAGKDDLFYGNAKKLHKRMNKEGIPHEYIVIGGGHYWRAWRKCLIQFLERLNSEE